MIALDLARCGNKIVQRIFGIDAAFDGTAIQPDLFLLMLRESEAMRICSFTISTLSPSRLPGALPDSAFTSRK